MEFQVKEILKMMYQSCLQFKEDSLCLEIVEFLESKNSGKIALENWAEENGYKKQEADKIVFSKEWFQCECGRLVVNDKMIAAIKIIKCHNCGIVFKKE